MSNSSCVLKRLQFWLPVCKKEYINLCLNIPFSILSAQTKTYSMYKTNKHVLDSEKEKHCECPFKVKVQHGIGFWDFVDLI